jgi:hypothetical protein
MSFGEGLLRPEPGHWPKPNRRRVSGSGAVWSTPEAWRHRPERSVCCPGGDTGATAVVVFSVVRSCGQKVWRGLTPWCRSTLYGPTVVRWSVSSDVPWWHLPRQVYGTAGRAMPAVSHTRPAGPVATSGVQLRVVFSCRRRSLEPRSRCIGRSSDSNVLGRWAGSPADCGRPRFAEPRRHRSAS